ncbi:rhodanese-related sulfurtransferase [Litoreibacter halocynthiae]|uniref:Rhodanese-related sulfurtransferase n=1 Tax=Litoreibacter halocynthiae TaxID=1242689 RepID=A0A4R7LL44_9RHOB|nr:rhodanese-like domain-containing protein [Litoreibacter halocynthiae]TDT75151.1 rhodanese-related sulfurtransferase [Litoreibacter halocynthiae]
MALKVSAAQMVERARARIEEVETVDAIAMVDDPNVVIVDLRDVRERHRSGYVPGSFHCPRGMAEFWVDPHSPYFKEVFAQDKKFVFHCASGWRSALTVATLNDMGFDAAHLREGFSMWEAQGGPVQRDS